MTRLLSAVERWRKVPAKVRAEVLGFFTTEAENSEYDARTFADHMGYHSKTQAESREDARAFRAAIAVLRAAARPKPTRKRPAARGKRLGVDK